MALAGTDRGTGFHNTSATSFTFSPASNLAAGSWATLVVAYDNSGGGGADPFTSVTDSHGNTWTSRRRALYDPGAGSAGATLAIVTTDMSVATLTTSSVITVTFGSATTAKAWALSEVAPAAGMFVSYNEAGNNTGSATGTPTVTSATIEIGHMIIAGGAAESANTWAGDADTTNGSWSTKQSNAAGTGATGQSVINQRKVTTASATQTFNPTLTSVDCILAWIELAEIGPLTRCVWFQE